MHRSAKAGAEGRKLKKLFAKTSWYKERDSLAAGEAESDSEPFDRFLVSPPRRAQQESKAVSPWDSKGGSDTEIKKEVCRKASPLTSVLFMEQTPGGVYAARLRETEKKLAPITNFRVKVVEKSGTTLKSILMKSDPWAGGVESSKCRKRNILKEITCREFSSKILLTKLCVL